MKPETAKRLCSTSAQVGARALVPPALYVAPPSLKGDETASKAPHVPDARAGPGVRRLVSRRTPRKVSVGTARTMAREYGRLKREAEI